MKYNFAWYPAWMVLPKVLEELSSLYSRHYGRWSDRASRNSGQPIRLTAKRIGEWMNSPDARLATARLQDGSLVGYAIAIQTKVKRAGVISWVTQLVVHENHRQRDLGKRLLFSIWSFTDHFAWGLVSANPYAVRALEKATRRRCSPDMIQKNRRKLRAVGMQHVAYITDETTIEVTPSKCRINTAFFQDMSQLDSMIERASTVEVPWALGSLDDGWEWLAFTFRDQQQISLTRQEIVDMLDSSDQVAREAYSRMKLDEAHAWMKHTDKEVDLIVNDMAIGPGSSVLDIGCGIGRHAIALAQRGVSVLGIDYLPPFIDQAEKSAHAKGVNERTTFLSEDARTLSLDREFDAVVCVYDVIGTFAEEEDNLRILEAIAKHVRPGGRALISVMNFELTEHVATGTISLDEDPDCLLELPPSNTMESTGNVFDPRYFLLDAGNQVVFRKEQFSTDGDLPMELIVRDRRFKKEEIEAMVAHVGLRVVWSRFTGAGRWSKEFDATDSKAKEILLLCEKPAPD